MILDQINNLIAGLSVNSKKLTRSLRKNKNRPVETFDSLENPDLSQLSSDELKKAIVKRINSLDQSNTNYQKKAITAFVEHAVAWEYGDMAYRDPKVSNAIDSIVVKIENDEELKKKYITMLDSLRK